jgi:hypothetical protein
MAGMGSFVVVLVSGAAGTQWDYACAIFFCSSVRLLKRRNGSVGFENVGIPRRVRRAIHQYSIDRESERMKE